MAKPAHGWIVSRPFHLHPWAGFAIRGRSILVGCRLTGCHWSSVAGYSALRRPYSSRNVVWPLRVTAFHGGTANLTLELP
jgi:hypothetical protein